MKRIAAMTSIVTACIVFAGCKKDEPAAPAKPDAIPTTSKAKDTEAPKTDAPADAAEHGQTHDGTHTHEGGQAHDHAHPHTEGETGHGHDDEADLGTAAVGDLEVKLAQGHGKVQAGKEGHLVVKLPYNDAGSTVVRAWIGTEDRTLSRVGKGQYAPSHGDYDIHATAPDPLPANAMWWIEVHKPDGTKLVGSAKPLM